MPTNTIRRKNGRKVCNKNATPRLTVRLVPDGVDGFGVIRWCEEIKPSRRTHTTPVARTTGNDGHDNPARIRHATTKAYHSGEVGYRETL